MPIRIRHVEGATHPDDIMLGCTQRLHGLLSAGGTFVVGFGTLWTSHMIVALECPGFGVNVIRIAEAANMNGWDRDMDEIKILQTWAATRIQILRVRY
jgi:hypothetical protein